jgi:RHS repeat-associated protein
LTKTCFGSPFTFTGELLDANALLYLRARYYSPALGAFTALDPVENSNRYQYVGANPLRYPDPMGLLKSEQVYASDTSGSRARYSCHCGWIDWSHLVNAEEIINNVYRAKELSYEKPYSFYGIQFEMMSKKNFKVFEAGPEVDDMAILPVAFLRT